MVISDRIQNITIPERRDFKNSETESRRRTGIPVSLARYDMGLATVIANTNRDASGRPLGAEMRASICCDFNYLLFGHVCKKFFDYRLKNGYKSHFRLKDMPFQKAF
jgi:hypothetical protein